MIKAPAKKQKENQNGKARAFSRYANQIAGTVLKSIKMASANVYDDLVSILDIVELLRELGPLSLSMKPEVLCAVIDRKYGGWSEERCAEAILKYHDTGVIDSGLSSLSRQKLYAARLVMISDAAYQEWHIFEKVGGVFNDRVASFSVSEPLSPGECARTAALMHYIRPDKFSDEILAYIAASCHVAGIYTTVPSEYLAMADTLLQMMNKEETGREVSGKIIDDIKKKLSDFRAGGADYSDESFVDVQAVKLLACDAYARLGLIKE